MEVEGDVETDVEDEYFVSVVPDSLGEGWDSSGGSGDLNVAGIPVYVQGRLIASGDVHSEGSVMSKGHSSELNE